MSQYIIDGNNVVIEPVIMVLMLQYTWIVMKEAEKVIFTSKLWTVVNTFMRIQITQIFINTEKGGVQPSEPPGYADILQFKW